MLSPILDCDWLLRFCKFELSLTLNCSKADYCAGVVAPELSRSLLCGVLLRFLFERLLWLSGLMKSYEKLA